MNIDVTKEKSLKPIVWYCYEQKSWLQQMLRDISVSTQIKNQSFVRLLQKIKPKMFHNRAAME